jgi:hypothetical protein
MSFKRHVTVYVAAARADEESYAAVSRRDQISAYPALIYENRSQRRPPAPLKR